MRGAFLGLPLPEAQRTLGPFSVQDVLNVLVGTAWRWHTDHITRRVWFTLAKHPSLAAWRPIVSPSTTPQPKASAKE
ncbi:integrating conjugative element protein PilL, PFGI-1 class [Comamonas testosteroni]|uniref:Integrating conjugative element protein PilL, PFGI-1 class n=1 Tax=Comamonas testosteroni TaxID=285 RepID=A0A8B4SC48_COMTE|nr:hypothetical protein [Comamonas testosteroni]SUY94678.1 integrating conjugative element protein PilL, PFGI-1 class [Comamonas testosteroni]